MGDNWDFGLPKVDLKSFGSEDISLDHVHGQRG